MLRCLIQTNINSQIHSPHTANQPARRIIREVQLPSADSTIKMCSIKIYLQPTNKKRITPVLLIASIRTKKAIKSNLLNKK